MTPEQLKMKMLADIGETEWLLYGAGINDYYHLGIKGQMEIEAQGLTAEEVLEYVKNYQATEEEEDALEQFLRLEAEEDSEDFKDKDWAIDENGKDWLDRIAGSNWD